MGDINPYEILKDTYKKIFSFKTHIKTFFFLTLIYFFSQIFTSDFLTIINIIKSFIPLRVVSLLNITLIPILNFLFFIGSLGILVAFLIAIIFEINKKKGWFVSFIFNYNYYFRGNKIGICDNIAEKFIALPINIALIISIICYFFNSNLIINYISNFKIILAAPCLVLYFYFLSILSLFFKKVDDEY